MKQTAVTVMTWIAYVIEWQRQSKAKIIQPRDMFAHDTQFVSFLRACFMYSDHTDNSTTYWLDTARREPMTREEQNKWILPLMKLTDVELLSLCKMAEVEEGKITKFIAKLNVGK